ncbi:hypothetical protein ADL22_24380 [Streptomyces sp. NRRL F-4489]|nr:hypothetical protein ADL22_24380 [Streptomyces sp. NRRL F-4489]
MLHRERAHGERDRQRDRRGDQVVRPHPHPGRDADQQEADPVRGLRAVQQPAVQEAEYEQREGGQQPAAQAGQLGGRQPAEEAGHGGGRRGAAGAGPVDGRDLVAGGRGAAAQGAGARPRHPAVRARREARARRDARRVAGRGPEFGRGRSGVRGVTARGDLRTGRYGGVTGGPHRGQEGVVGVGGHGLRGARQPGVPPRLRAAAARPPVPGPARLALLHVLFHVVLHPATVGR